jgi:hypothetical protein
MGRVIVNVFLGLAGFAQKYQIIDFSAQPRRSLRLGGEVLLN